MATPLTTGRLPFHLEAPAFPSFRFLCWGLDRTPMVAVHLARTDRCSPLGSLMTAYAFSPSPAKDIGQWKGVPLDSYCGSITSADEPLARGHSFVLLAFPLLGVTPSSNDSGSSKCHCHSKASLPVHGSTYKPVESGTSKLHRIQCPHNQVGASGCLALLSV
jgi:hypothetical protein